MESCLKRIVDPRENYKGLSYGSWAAIFWNWLLSEQAQTSSIFFLRGNVDTEPPLVMPMSTGLTLDSNTGIFFPIICSISSSLETTGKDLVTRRIDSAKSQMNPRLLRANIDGEHVPGPENYYSETPAFILTATRNNKLRTKVRPKIRSGKAHAVSAGYWMILKSLPLGIHRIRFKGIHRDGFETSGDYILRVVKRSTR